MTDECSRLTRPITSLAVVVGLCCSRSKIVYHGNFFVANAHLCVGNFAVLIFVLIYTYLFRELPHHQEAVSSTMIMGEGVTVDSALCRHHLAWVRASVRQAHDAAGAARDHHHRLPGGHGRTRLLPQGLDGLG